MKIIKYLTNIKDAFRVLEIMDRASCDIEKVTRDGLENYDYWVIKPKFYVSEKEAKDLRKIVLYKEHYKDSSKLLHSIFYRNRRYGTRDFR